MNDINIDKVLIINCLQLVEVGGWGRVWCTYQGGDIAGIGVITEVEQRSRLVQ